MKPPTGDPDPTLFEMGAIAVQLKFHYDALLFMERVKAATQSCRYKVRQFAKRRHDGTIPIAGFSALLCKTSEGDYAKTLARLIFFIVQKQPVMSKRVSDSLDAGHSPSHIERMTAIQDLLLRPSVKEATATDFYWNCLSSCITLLLLMGPSIDLRSLCNMQLCT